MKSKIKERDRQEKLLDNLKISIEEIEHSDLKNNYMENNQRLRLNVNVFTEIIKRKKYPNTFTMRLGIWRVCV